MNLIPRPSEIAALPPAQREAAFLALHEGVKAEAWRRRKKKGQPGIKFMPLLDIVAEEYGYMDWNEVCQLSAEARARAERADA